METPSSAAPPDPSAHASRSEPHDISQLHTTLLRPSAGSSSPVPSTAPESRIRLAAEAGRWREQAGQGVDELTQDMRHFAAAVGRWQRLTRLTTRTVVEEAALAAIERDLPAHAQRMARTCERWTACLVAAREHDDARRERLRAT